MKPYSFKSSLPGFYTAIFGLCFLAIRLMLKWSHIFDNFSIILYGILAVCFIIDIIYKICYPILIVKNGRIEFTIYFLYNKTLIINEINEVLWDNTELRLITPRNRLKIDLSDIQEKDKKEFYEFVREIEDGVKQKTR